MSSDVAMTMNNAVTSNISPNREQSLERLAAIDNLLDKYGNGNVPLMEIVRIGPLDHQWQCRDPLRELYTYGSVVK